MSFRLRNRVPQARSLGKLQVHPSVAFALTPCGISSTFLTHLLYDLSMNDVFTFGWLYRSFDFANTHPCSPLALSAVPLSPTTLGRIPVFVCASRPILTIFPWNQCGEQSAKGSNRGLPQSLCGHYVVSSCAYLSFSWCFSASRICHRRGGIGTKSRHETVIEAEDAARFERTPDMKPS